MKWFESNFLVGHSGKEDFCYFSQQLIKDQLIKFRHSLNVGHP